MDYSDPRKELRGLNSEATSLRWFVKNSRSARVGLNSSTDCVHRLVRESRHLSAVLAAPRRVIKMQILFASTFCRHGRTANLISSAICRAVSGGQPARSTSRRARTQPPGRKGGRAARARLARSESSSRGSFAVIPDKLFADNIAFGLLWSSFRPPHETKVSLIII